MQVLPGSKWRNTPGLERLTTALGSEQGEVRFVGGCVRDAIIGVDAADVDCSTVHRPSEAMRRAREAGFPVIPTGLHHGTFTAMLPDSVPIEITTLRRDVETDGGHAVVAFTDDWRVDAERRDFTFNALSADPVSGEVHDYFGGLEDLRRGVVRFVGDASERVAEDHLRIMRFYRFQGRFGGESVDRNSRAACREAAFALKYISVERVRAELLKILSQRNPAAIVGMMDQDGIMAHAGMRSVAVGALGSLTAREKAMSVPADPILRLASLLPLIPREAERLSLHLKLSKAESSRLVSACDPERVPEGPLEAAAYRLGRRTIADRLMLSFTTPETLVAESMSFLESWEKPILPIKGGDLIAMGLDKGPRVSKVLDAVEKLWVEHGFPDEERTRDMARGVLRSAGVEVRDAGGIGAIRPIGHGDAIGR